MYRMLISVLMAVTLCFAYSGGLHRAMPEVVPSYLSQAGYQWEADTATKYMSALCDGAVSPDADHPEMKIPENLLPDWAKEAGSTSIAKWEHCILDDLPPKLEDALGKVCELYGFKYQYADSCASQWMAYAVRLWKNGQIDSSMFVLGRVCHLVQDITVPMHTHLTTNLLEAWRVVNKMELNQVKFEKRALDTYIAGARAVDFATSYQIPGSMYGTAEKSRKRFKFCDGVGIGGPFNYPPLVWILPCLAENFDKAVNESVDAAEINTVMVIHYFFMKVTKQKE